MSDVIGVTTRTWPPVMHKHGIWNEDEAILAALVKGNSLLKEREGYYH
jgi:hypothetical protein